MFRFRSSSYHWLKLLFNVFLEILVQLIPILGSIDLLDVIQSVRLLPSQDTNDVVDPVRGILVLRKSLRQAQNGFEILPAVTLH